MEKSGIVHRSAVGRKIFNTDKCAMGFKNHIYAFDWQKILNFEGGNALAADCRLGGNQLVLGGFREFFLKLGLLFQNKFSILKSKKGFRRHSHSERCFEASFWLGKINKPAPKAVLRSKHKSSKRWTCKIGQFFCQVQCQPGQYKKLTNQKDASKWFFWLCFEINLFWRLIFLFWNLDFSFSLFLSQSKRCFKIENNLSESL